ncbi:class I adenylate-forming enzyme family protein [Castellaniella sp.]|uniref:class I adenylate-forming enzyme family protein n=1 Tax=Castellaniella sp. TaxID=1955812 RepID=UPI002AFF070D|nr:AMP-binding protein [Castellaniella sp.]
MSLPVLNFAEMLEAKARLMPNRLAARDLERSLTFGAWDARANRLANALASLGLVKGDRLGVLAYNCLEWAELYIATAKSGVIIVPINFRLSPLEILNILQDCGARGVIVQDGLHGLIEEIRGDLAMDANQMVHFGTPQAPSGWKSYESIIAGADEARPTAVVLPDDPWAFMYTSGTTGRPKGVIRSHRGMVMLALITEVELSVRSDEDALLVMPMCHANSLNFFCSYVYCGACVTIYSRKRFDPEHVAQSMSELGTTFTSLVPTQYIMLLDRPRAEISRWDLGRVEKLMISSAPARADTKRQVMEMFSGAGLFELYGSSEAGWVTMLHPREQFSHLGTVGRECVGSGPIRILDQDGHEVPDGQSGELFSLTPYPFSGYWNQPEKTAEAFRGAYCSVGDVALRDSDGFIRLVDRKENMIISGGENIYPTEIEAVISGCPLVRDVAVVGVPDDKWGESVHAVVVLCDGADADAQAIINWCNGRLAGYKRPRTVSFVDESGMPRTATGKIRHSALKKQLSTPASA